MCRTLCAGKRAEMDHLVLMLWHALLVSIFFAFLWRTDNKGRRNLFFKTFLIMMVGGAVLSWLMYPFP